MGALLKYEWKAGIKALLIWSLAVGIMGMLCIVLYKSMEESMAGMAENFASMGAFSDAMGMSTLSIATLKGYFATEIGTVHSLGSSLFAASIATAVLSKEEDGHTAEFTYTLPVSRAKVVVVKFISVVMHLMIFTVVCGLLYQVGILLAGEQGLGKEYLIFMGSQLLMNIEIATVCFLISACSRKNKLGFGIGVAMILYVYDLMARVIPDLKDAIFLSPFSYANATGIFAGTADNATALIFGVGIMLVSAATAGVIYCRRDLAS